MNIDSFNSFLIIDDDEMTLMAVKTLVNKSFLNSVIYSAPDGESGWELINKHHPNIVVSDMSMPGMSGLDLCNKVRSNSELNDIYFIILTGVHDKELKLKIIDEGADDFINKPVTSEDLLARLRTASRFVGAYKKVTEEYSLLNDLATELENDISDMKNLALSFQYARFPASVELLKNIPPAAVWIAKTTGECSQEEVIDVELAANFCYIGRLSLPDNLISNQILSDGTPSNNLFYQVPVSARNIINNVRRFKDVGNILYHVYENLDGSGFPEKIRGWQIPLGSRIIRVVQDFEELRFLRKISPKTALEVLQKEAKRIYDPRILVLLEQYLTINKLLDTSSNEKIVSLAELKNGMVISRDIISNNGLKLISAGVILHDEIIRKIIAHNTTDPILGYIFIQA